MTTVTEPDEARAEARDERQETLVDVPLAALRPARSRRC